MTRADLTLPPRARLAVVTAVVVFHLLLALGLLRAFTPDITARVADKLSSVLIVTLTTPEPERRVPEKQGVAAAAGRKAVPKPESAPKPKIEIATVEKDVPLAASRGDDDLAGARETGADTGAQGEKLGAGAGRAGLGQGGGAVQKLKKIAGDINSARDYPRATRELREGHSVIIQLTVGTDGRASNCRIISPSPDAEADRITCRLAVERFRFRPRTNALGVPIPGEYRWRQRWWDPRD
jgi:protein TonB